MIDLRRAWCFHDDRTGKLGVVEDALINRLAFVRTIVPKCTGPIEDERDASCCTASHEQRRRQRLRGRRETTHGQIVREVVANRRYDARSERNVQQRPRDAQRLADFAEGLDWEADRPRAIRMPQTTPCHQGEAQHTAFEPAGGPGVVVRDDLRQRSCPCRSQGTEKRDGRNAGQH